jgi:heat shock protein HtpX
MKWKADWGLRLRMGATMFLLFGLYIVFATALLMWFDGGLLMISLLFGSFTLVQFLFSDRLTLWSMGAQKVSEQEFPELHTAVGRLARQEELPKPTVAVVESSVPNAFATGRSQRQAVVCVTTGLLSALDQDELDGVLAHELGHVKNRDMVVMTIASFLSTIAFIVARWGLFFGGGQDGDGSEVPAVVAVLASLVVWIVSYLLTRVLSQYREYAADRAGAVISGKPAALASALQKISGRMKNIPTEDMRDQASMNAFFILPVSARDITRLFSTHPPVERRIQRLQELEREMERV